MSRWLLLYSGDPGEIHVDLCKINKAGQDISLNTNQGKIHIACSEGIEF